MYKFKKYKKLFLIVAGSILLIYQLINDYRSGSVGSGSEQNTYLVQLFEQKRSNQFLTVEGKVRRLLRDDTKGSQHQRFLIDVNGVSVLVAHNIDLAKRVPLSVGDRVTLHGEYEYTAKGGVIHWTHHNPNPNGRKFGWIDHEGIRYK